MTTIEDVQNAQRCVNQSRSDMLYLMDPRVQRAMVNVKTTWFKMGWNRGIAVGMVMGGLLVAAGYHGYFLFFQ